MDFLNQATTQITDLLKQMTPGTRVVAALLLVAVVVSLFFLTQYEIVGGDEFLLSGRPFSAAELTAAEAAFAKAGLKGSIVEGSRIRIPRGKKDAYLAALLDNNALPADPFHFSDKAAAADNPFLSSKAMEAQRLHAKQKELSLIISRMRGIQLATVQFDEIEKDPFRRLRQKTAMVAVQTTGEGLENDQVKAIRNVVASAYAGLERKNITVTDMTTGLSFSAVDEDGQSTDDSLYAAHKSKFEKDWRQKIHQQLSMIPNVIVGVNVELTPEIRNSSQTIKLDPKPLTVSSSESSKDQSSTQPGNAGRPGAVPNGVGNQPQTLAGGATGGVNSQNTESRSEVKNIAGHETIAVQKAPLVPNKVTASIDVPRSYFLKVWKERTALLGANAPKQPDPTELEKIETETVNRIRETVRNLLPTVATGTNPYPHIVVASYTDFAAEAPAKPSSTDNAMVWIAGNWQTLAMLAVGLFALMMVRGLARGPKPPAAPAAAAAADGHAAGHGGAAAGADDHADEDEPEAAGEVTHTLKRKFGTGGPSLKDDLKELVKEDPDAAATILRAWIGDAA